MYVMYEIHVMYAIYAMHVMHVMYFMCVMYVMYIMYMVRSILLHVTRGRRQIAYGGVLHSAGLRTLWLTIVLPEVHHMKKFRY